MSYGRRLETQHQCELGSVTHLFDVVDTADAVYSALVGFLLSLTPLTCDLMGWRGAGGNGAADIGKLPQIAAVDQRKPASSNFFRCLLLLWRSSHDYWLSR